MGNQEVEARGDGLPQSSYSVIAFPGRSFPAQYRNLVLKSWMKTLRHGNEYFKLIQSDPYFENYQRYIESVIARPNSVMRFAVLSDDHDVVLGWSLVEGSTLHYVNVQYEQRNAGIARALVPAPISTITHLTKAGLRIWSSKLPNAVFNPFA